MLNVKLLDQNNQTLEKTYQDPAEDFLINFFNKPQSQKNKSIAKILSINPSWPILYHLSYQRELLLNWYPFNKKSNLLEIGAGCGALTGLFCTKVNKVIANELTTKRASIIAKRYADKKNLQVWAGNLSNFNTDEKFDYISLIGVLEYAGMFYPGDRKNNFYDPYLDSLKKLIPLLTTSGKLLLAIENKLGFKYIAGGKEDHYGSLFSSLENYPNYTGIRTFSKGELIKLLHLAGFKKINFFYPFPDYKLPNIVFSDFYLKNGLNLPKSYYAHIVDQAHQRIFLFNEVIFAENLFQEHVLDKFANSFLVEASL